MAIPADNNNRKKEHESPLGKHLGEGTNGEDLEGKA